MVRDFGAKLRITAAVLGCASQKDLCARFHEVNPETIFELDRSYKWMQGRALPRSARVYEDGRRCSARAARSRSCSRARSTSSSIWSAIATRSAGTPSPLGRASWSVQQRTRRRRTAATKRGSSGRGRHLVGTYAWYWRHPGRPVSRARSFAGGLVIAATAAGEPELHATTIYSGPTRWAGSSCAGR